MNPVENIIRFRKQKGYSQEYVASSIGRDTAVISNLEKGKRLLKFIDLEEISKVLEIDIITLITYPDIYVKQEYNLEIENYHTSDKDKVIRLLNERIRFQEDMIKELLAKIK